MRILALQSGTSVDAIDVAVVDFRTTGIRAADSTAVEARVITAVEHPWPEGLRARLLDAVGGVRLTAGELCELDTLSGQEFARAAATVAHAGGIRPDLVVSHGQTLHHWVDASGSRGTLQVGEPAWIAEAIHAPVLSDLRAADIASGGSGAPLMSVFDSAWLAGVVAGAGGAVATVNLGGIANVQVVRPDTATIAFDTGPANALLDAAVQRALGDRAVDEGGRLAESGTVDVALLRELRAHPYFALPAPKSTGRETFHVGVVLDALARTNSAPPLEDLLATLARLTATTVADALRPFAPADVIVSGGGVNNRAMMSDLRAALPESRVATSDEYGISAQHKESIMFAFLGFLAAHRVPLRLAATPADGARVAGRMAQSFPWDPPAPIAAIRSLTLAPPSEEDS